MSEFSVEVTRPSATDIAFLAAQRPGAKAYLSMVPGRSAEETIGHAAQLRAAGLEPVPHLAVRNFASVEALDQVLIRLKHEAAVDSVLVIAGDRSECGPFRCALDVIDSGLLRRRGVRSIGIAGYPQGHPRIGQDELKRALAEKIAAAEATGLKVEIVTQFCFDAPAILSFIAEVRGYGFDHRVRIGLAGPTSLSSLMRTPRRCGVRTSVHALGAPLGPDAADVCHVYSRRLDPGARGSGSRRRRAAFLFLRRHCSDQPLGQGPSPMAISPSMLRADFVWVAGSCARADVRRRADRKISSAMYPSHSCAVGEELRIIAACSMCGRLLCGQP